MSWMEDGQFVESSCSPWTLKCMEPREQGSPGDFPISKIVALKTGETLEVDFGKNHIKIEATDEIYDWEEDEREMERDRRTQAMEMAHNCESFNDYMGY